jgi:Protein of unknown function (DUF2786)
MNLDVIIDKIGKLLNKAESLGDTPEAASFRAKAEEWMREYRVEQEHLLADDPMAVAPVLVTMDLCPSASRFLNDYWYLMYLIADHVGIKVKHAFGRDEITRDRVLQAAMVGYEGDIRYAQYLFSAARLVFAAKLEPHVDAKLSDEENVYRLRSSGLPRNRVANLLWGASVGSDGAAAHARVGKLYKSECARRGETPALDGREINAKTYQAVYARQFGDTFGRRLREARDAADSIGGAIMLHGRSERVQEAFWDFFPEERPSDAPAVEETKPTKARKYRGPTQAQMDRAHRFYYSASAQAGTAAGRQAASQIEIDRASRARRVEEAGTSTPIGQIGR